MRSAILNGTWTEDNHRFGHINEQGVEIIEARWLFDVPAETDSSGVHPSPFLHSAIEFVTLYCRTNGAPDMRLPIHYSLFFPGRVESNTVPRLDLVKLGELTF